MSSCTSGCAAAQWVAVGIASLAIVVLTVDYGRLPWIALVLATSFGLYGYFKKRASVGALESVAVETGFLALPALAVLVVIELQGTLAFAHVSAGNSALLALTGVVTAVPLLFFAAAARRLPLTVIGLLQYLAPVLQFAVGVGIDHEAMTPARWAGFGLVWIALVVLTVDGVRTQRRACGAVSRRGGRRGLTRLRSDRRQLRDEPVAVTAVPTAYPLDRRAVGLEAVPAQHQHRRAGVGAEQGGLPGRCRRGLDGFLSGDRRNAIHIGQNLDTATTLAAHVLDQSGKCGDAQV